MIGTNAKFSPQLNAYHKIFVNNFVSQMERKLKVNFEERRKEKKE